MRKRFTSAAILLGLAAGAGAQPGARVTLPPNTRQTGQLPIANTCLSGQTFKVNSEPPADWVRFEPSAVNVGRDSSFGVSVTVTAGNRGPGTYRTTVRVICSSCAASEPPCMQDPREIPLEMTVAGVRTAGEFQPIPEPIPDSPAAVSATPDPQPMPYIQPEQPQPSGNRVFLLVAGALLAVGLVGIVFAILSLTVGRKGRVPNGEVSPESERHQVRR